MKSRLIIPVIFLVVIFSSCNDPMDKTYSPETYINDISEMRGSDKVNAEDIELLTKYITVSKLAGNDLEGRTYGEILEKIKDIRKTNTDQADQMNLEKEAARERMSSFLRVNLTAKQFLKIYKKDNLTYTVTFQNLTPENIKLVVGSISITDLLDREIYNLQIILDDKLPANGTLVKIYPVAYDHTSESHKHVRSKELLDLRILWNPQKIVFEDGTIAE